MQIPKQASDIAWNQLGDIVVILEMRDDRMFHELNESASFLWTQMNGQQTISALAESLASEFDIPFDQAQCDVRKFIHTLENADLITWSES